MVILENKSLKVVTLAVGEAYDFEPVFVYDMEYSELTSNTVVKYESKRAKIATVGEFGRVIGKRIGTTEIKYIVTNPAFDDNAVYVYDLKVNVIDPKDVIEEVEEVKPEPPKCDDCKPVAIPVEVVVPVKPVKPVVAPLTTDKTRTVAYIAKIVGGLRTLATRGLAKDTNGRLSLLSVLTQVNLYSDYKDMLAEAYSLDKCMIVNAINTLCCEHCECKDNLAKVLKANASWDRFYSVNGKLSENDRLAFNTFISNVIASTFKL